VSPLKLSQKFKLTLACFELQTGRSHQIRVQANESGFPLLGDTKYFSTSKGLEIEFPRPALHSSRLEFTHPIEKIKMVFEAPLPKDITGVLRKYDFKDVK